MQIRVYLLKTFPAFRRALRPFLGAESISPTLVRETPLLSFLVFETGKADPFRRTPTGWPPWACCLLLHSFSGGRKGHNSCSTQGPHLPPASVAGVPDLGRFTKESLFYPGTESPRSILVLAPEEGAEVLASRACASESPKSAQSGHPSLRSGSSDH